jgi:dipeptidyl aminopeptidase/acylaminoacyl peptidase
MKILNHLLIATLLTTGTVARGAEPAAGDDAAAFGALETIYTAALSADGKKLVYTGPGTGPSTIAVVIDLTTGSIAQVARGDGNPINITNCQFAAADRIVCTLWGLTHFQSYLVPMRRTLSMDPDGKNQIFLGQKDTLEQVGKRFGDGEVLDWLNGVDGMVLMARSYVPESTTGRMMGRKEEGLGVDRIDARTGKVTQVERPGDDTSGYISDGLGNIRIMSTLKVTESGLMTGVENYSYRTTGDRTWKPLGSYTVDRKGGGRGTGLYPQAVDPTINSVYVIKGLDGRDALYRIKLDGSMASELVVSNKDVDVDGVVTIGRGGRVIGATYATDRRFIRYFDPDYKKIQEMLERALPKTPLISFESASADEQFLVVRASSDTEPGNWYLYDRAKKSLGVISPARPAMKGRKLSEMKAVSYPAADGTQIPGYLTLPPGVTEAKNLPAIVLPHGGPGARDEWGFDWLSQYFAQRGFVVLQPNFRGSEGFGAAWYASNGIRGWKTSIGDVCDAGRWMVKQGMADPSKLAIFGWSYGGYAALQSNVLDPDLFKAVVAVAPVTDFAMMKTRGLQYGSGFLLADFIGSGPHIKEGSPAQNVGVFKAPVIMFHGDNDLNVDIGQSKLMDKEMHKAGKASELVVYKDLEHSLRDGTVRADMLRKSDAFLRKQLKL